jgi:hypothetical protein
VKYNAGIFCDACGIRHFINKNVNGFRMFKGIDLCHDCYSIQEIRQHVQETRLKLLKHEASQDKWYCALCKIVLFDPNTLESFRSFERDHIDVFKKTCSVWELIVKGASIDCILLETKKCRNLCIRCHSAVTCAERAVGILGLKVLERNQSISNYDKARATIQVDALTRMLLS